jgi:hypothetical protein
MSGYFIPTMSGYLSTWSGISLIAVSSYFISAHPELVEGRAANDDCSFILIPLWFDRLTMSGYLRSQ